MPRHSRSRDCARGRRAGKPRPRRDPSRARGRPSRETLEAPCTSCSDGASDGTRQHEHRPLRRVTDGGHGLERPVDVVTQSLQQQVGRPGAVGVGGVARPVVARERRLEAPPGTRPPVSSTVPTPATASTVRSLVRQDAGIQGSPGDPSRGARRRLTAARLPYQICSNRRVRSSITRVAAVGRRQQRQVLARCSRVIDTPDALLLEAHESRAVGTPDGLAGVPPRVLQRAARSASSRARGRVDGAGAKVERCAARTIRDGPRQSRSPGR